MLIRYGKKLTDKEIESVKEISSCCGVSERLATLLLYRNIDTVEKAERFLAPSKKFFYSPFLLTGIDKAVDRLNTAKIKGESVLVFGDYDADGICAATVLSGCLRDLGVNVFSIVPERENGYGLNIEIIDEILKTRPIDLIVTVDCGISDAEIIEEIKKRYIDVIVTDHHEPPEILPDCICINPKIKGQNYPFGGLCGAGVAYKLGVALNPQKADEYLDLVATATVADSMDLIDENRDIVAEGLKIFNSRNLREAFKYLLGENGKEVTSQTLAYSVAPKINAGGRQGDANCALNLFKEENPAAIYDYAVKLNAYNIARQNDCETVYSSAFSVIREEQTYKDDIILVKGDDWNAGVIGIVAAKLCENFGKPVIVFAKFKDVYKGSCRSIDGINIFEALSSVKNLLKEFGGHSQAAGLSVLPENFLKLRRALNDYVKEHAPTFSEEKEIFADMKADFEITSDFAKEIELLEPFGVGNRRPLFTTDVKAVNSKPLKADSPHYSFNAGVCETLDFNGAYRAELLNYPIEKTLVFELNYSEFRGKEYVKGILKETVYDKAKLVSDILKDVEEEKIQNVTSSRSAFVTAFNVIKENADKKLISPIETYFSAQPAIGLKQFVVCYYVFLELGFFTEEQEKLIFKEGVKKDLNDSALYRALKRKGL